ncbi:hypothetical protein CRUP_032551 [Coryphaenoides rupestris]|nr:hypothetical protein CRUP_032551 [Coryphaenoides rupestris]
MIRKVGLRDHDQVDLKTVARTASMTKTRSASETMTQLPEVTRPMTYLGEETVSMAKLTHLFLDHMFLQALYQTPSLVHMDLSHNQLRHLDTLYPRDLRCQSQDAMLKAEFEEATRVAPPTEAPEAKAETNHSTCENRGHTKVPQGFSADTKLLDLRGNHFHYVPSNSFPGIAQVVSLHLQRCKIAEVEDGAFNGMKGLVYLYLSENDLTSLSPEAFKGLPHLTYLHLEKNRFTSFPKGAFKLLPGLLALHLEDNSITKLETGSLVGGGEGVRGLYLTGNAINGVSPRALHQANDLNILHLGGNRLKEVPSEALSKAGNLGELKLSGNPIRWVGANAFRALGGTLKELYLDHTGLEKMSKESLAGLGAGLRSLYLEGNQLEEVPDLHPFTSLEVINLAENPLLCDCPLLPLRMWIEKVNLKVRATCANPPEIRGRRVKDVHVFRACPGGERLPSSQILGPKTSKTPKTTKPKPAQLNGPRLGKVSKAKSNPRTGLTGTAAAAKRTSKRRSEA